MSLISAFNTLGPTVLVGVSAVQVLGSSSGCYRVRCLAAAYLSFGGSGVTAVGAPTAGTPSANTIGMAAGTVETFTFPPQAYFISTLAASFEITPGDGL